MAERKTYEELTFCDDFMFYKVLENDPDLCKALLEVILGHKIRGHVQVRKQASIDHSALSHSVKFDVYATDKKEKQTMCRQNLRISSSIWKSRRQAMR